MKNRLISFIASFLLMASVGVGFASWNFSSEASSTNNVIVNVMNWTFNKVWTGSDKLDEETFEMAETFEIALSDPNSPEGKAWTQAWNSKNTLGNSYVGSMDRNADDEFEQLFESEDASIIVKRRNNNQYELYVTYVDLSRNRTVSPVYKTTYYRQSDGTFIPILSEVGTCQRNQYSALQLGTYGFDTESFTRK